MSCAGNNVLDTYAATRLAADLARSGRGPVIIFAETFRMGGHATHDEREAREIFPAAVFEYWGKRDPVGMYESYLERRGIGRAALQDREREVIEEIARAEQEALDSRDAKMPRPEAVIRGVYGDQDAGQAEISSKPAQRKADSIRKMPSI
jgi:2-oxoisovalerate dehydrogenase E1 component alpha subunit